MLKDACFPFASKACGVTKDFLRQIAFQTGFCKRASGKIDAAFFFQYLCEESVKGTVSHNDLAAKIEETTNISVSRQACWERMNRDDACVNFFQTALAELMLSKLLLPELDWLKTNGMFKRILIQDSTVIQLPARLFPIFSGVKNAKATACNARIQGIYDLLSGRFIKFSIDPYSKNDVSVAAEIPVQHGDLLLRDRGYFLLKTIAEHKQMGVDTISRYKHKTTLYDCDTKKEIDLLELLSRNGSVDMTVFAGEDKNSKLRLMAVPVPTEVANLRRMKAKKENKSDPSQELLKLMSWSIFLVTIEEPAITIKHIFALYALRWRIENIFKTWKSNFSFSKLHNVSARQLRVLITARLFMIQLFYHCAYMPLSLKVFNQSKRQLSLMKFMRYIQQNFVALPKILNPRCWKLRFLNALARYCTYEKRKRQNFITKSDVILMELFHIHTLA